MLLFSGCQLIFPKDDESFLSSSPQSKPTSYTEEFQNRWSYQRLSPRLQTAYSTVYTAVRNSFSRDETVIITDSATNVDREYTGIRVQLSQPLNSREDAQALYTAFVWDNPQFFYIGNTYSSEGYRKGNTDYFNVLCLVYTMTAQERAVASRQLSEQVGNLIRHMRQTVPDDPFEKELYLHDRLMDIVSYDIRVEKEENPAALYPTAFSAYGALVEGHAVCEGYARAMQLLLHQAGLDCTLVSGTDELNRAHMWNLVTIDGRNYHLDPTWNDSSNMPHHSYFNLTTSEILKTHTIDTENLGVDTCTAIEANYYVRRGLYITTTSRDDIAAIIAERVRKGDTTIDLRFSRNVFANARLFINNRDLLTEKVNAQLSGEAVRMWRYEEYNINEKYGTITLYRAKN